MSIPASPFQPTLRLTLEFHFRFSSYLFPEDDGLCTPNLSNSHICVADEQDGVGGSIHIGEGVNDTFTFPSDIPGRPYRWAQWLGGLCFSSAGRQVVYMKRYCVEGGERVSIWVRGRAEPEIKTKECFRLITTSRDSRCQASARTHTTCCRSIIGVLILLCCCNMC